MNIKRLNATEEQDVDSANALENNLDTAKMGAGITYSIASLIKKLQKMICSCASKFSAAIIKLVTGFISKLKKLGRCLMPAARTASVTNREVTAVKLDMTCVHEQITETAPKKIFSLKKLLVKTFGYVAPVASVLFLVSLIRYASALEYGLTAEAAATYEEPVAVTVVQMVELPEIEEVPTIEESSVFFSPKLSLRMLEGEARDISASELASSMFGVSDADFAEAFGIYIDGEFLGSVEDKTAVEAALAELLGTYSAMEGVTEARFCKSVEYREGLYLNTTLTDSAPIIERLSGYEQTEEKYIVERGDNLTMIAQAHEMTLEQIMAINPQITNPNLCNVGAEITVSKAEKFMPVEYTKVVEQVAPIAYETLTVNNDALYVGQSEVLVSGENGEAVNKVAVTYVDDYEVVSEVIESVVTKEPVAEMLSVGTITRKVNAQPSSSSTVVRGSGQFMWAVDGGYISSYFGDGRNHMGIDIAAPCGTSIFAAGAGTVIAAGWNSGGYGYFVMIDHGDGYATLYGHLSKVIATNGQRVECGDIIGEVGNTGRSYGNHLHFEVRYNNSCMNPINYLRVNC